MIVIYDSIPISPIIPLSSFNKEKKGMLVEILITNIYMPI
ncbi:hypothetical protein M6K109_2692 [Staphylococcus aureus]|nr:hypothetical protein M6K109_2692 [Staphylococcus aureus]